MLYLFLEYDANIPFIMEKYMKILIIQFGKKNRKYPLNELNDTCEFIEKNGFWMHLFAMTIFLICIAQLNQ